MMSLASIGNGLASAVLWPGTRVCEAAGIQSAYLDLVRMLVNSLVWVTLGIIAVAMAA
jgi:hypothetical protein